MTVSEVAGRVRRRAADRAYAGALVIFPDELALLLSEAGWLGPFPAVVEPVVPLSVAFRAGLPAYVEAERDHGDAA